MRPIRMDIDTLELAALRMRFMFEHGLVNLMYHKGVTPEENPELDVPIPPSTQHVDIRTVRHLIAAGPEAVAAAWERQPPNIRAQPVWDDIRRRAESREPLGPLYGPLSAPLSVHANELAGHPIDLSFEQLHGRFARLIERLESFDRDEMRGQGLDLLGSTIPGRSFLRRPPIAYLLERFANASDGERRLLQIIFPFKGDRRISTQKYCTPEAYLQLMALSLCNNSNFANLCKVRVEDLERLKARGLIPEWVAPGATPPIPPPMTPFRLDDGDFMLFHPYTWAMRDIYCGEVTFPYMRAPHPRPGSAKKWWEPRIANILAHRLPKAPPREEVYLEDTYPGINDIYGHDFTRDDGDWVIEAMCYGEWPSSVGVPLRYEEAVEMAHVVAEVLEPIHADGHVLVGIRPELTVFLCLGVRLMAFSERLRIERNAPPAFEDDYAAPEVRQGRVGPEADVYSLGRMLAYWLTGQGPGPNGRAVQNLSRVGTTVRALIEQMIHPRPDARPRIGDVRRTLWAALVAHFGDPM